MGERLIYHSSLGFVMVVAYVMVTGLEKLKLPLRGKKVLLFSSLSILLVLFGFKTYERNAVWKNG